ncbi:MAG: hypothetical protein ABIR36_11120 [Nitrospiraceae bacterium]
MARDIKETSKWAWARWGDYTKLSALLDLLGWKTLVISMLSTVGVFRWIWEPGNRPMTALIGLVAVLVVCGFSIWLQVRDRGSETSNARHNPSGRNRSDGESVEFFGTINELRMRHPLPETFKPGNEIHAYLLSGEGIFAEHSKYVRYVKRLILPLPTGANMDMLKSLSNSLDYGAQILRCRDMALRNDKKSVRLYRNFLGMSLLFCNPDRQDGWVQIGPILPGTESAERQHFRLYRAKHEDAFLSFYKAFQWLWEESVVEIDQEGSASLPQGYISMGKAARTVYEMARANKIALAEGAERLSGWSQGSPSSGSQEDILHFMATHLVKNISVYGRRPPSTAFEKISDRDVKDFMFSEGAMKLKDPLNEAIYYTDLAVESDELTRQLAFEIGFTGDRST